MTDKANKALLKAANIRISTLVWKLHRAIENAKEHDNSFTEVEAIRKLAIDSFKLFIEHGVLDENAHLHKPKNRSPRPHSASPNRRQNVRTTPGSTGSAGKRTKSAARMKDVRATPFCDDVKITLNFEDDQTHDCFERIPRKPRDFEEKYKEANFDNICLGQELDRVNKYIAELESQNEYLTYQVDLAEKEKSDASRKLRRNEEDLNSVKDENTALRHVNENKTKMIEEIQNRDSNNNDRVKANRYRSERNLVLCENEELKAELEKRKDNSLQTDLEYLKKTLRRNEVDLKRVKDENTALRHANENKTKMIEEIQNRAKEEIKDANNAIVYYKEEQQRYKKAKDDNNAQIVKLRTEKDDANGRLAKLTTERDDANKRLAKLRTERDQLNSDAARLKVEKDELLNKLQKQKSSNNAGRHCEDALNKQLHEKDMESKQSKKIVENLNRKLDEIQRQQKEFLKPRDREDLKREENYNRKLVEENEELRNTVFEMEQQLKINKGRKYVLEKENEEISKKYQDVLRKLRESESRYSSQSDIEKENESLKYELTMSLMNIEKIKQEYKDLEKRLDTEITRNKETTYRLQNDLDRLKSQQDLQKQTSRGELESLKEQRAKLESDKQILRTKIYSLENEKIGLEERIKKAELILENQQTLREENSDLKESLETMKKEMENMEEKYKKETAIRICTDGTTTKLKEENDRLWKERNKAKYDIDRISREKEELAHELQHEIDAAKVEYDNLKKDENELTSTFQQRAKKDQEKIDQLEKERETLVARNTSGEKATQHNMYELLQLKNDYAACKQQKTVLEEDLRDQRQELTEHKKRIKDLESKDQRCTKCDLYERTLAKLKKENQELQDKYKKETAIRISTDGTTTKLKDENDRLRKERNRANIDVERISREKEELEHELQHEIDAAKLEHDNLKKDKNELTSLFQQKAKSYQEKIDQLEKECETLVARNISGVKTTQHNTYELLQLKNDYAVCKQQKALLEEDLSDQRQDITELEKRIKDLESKDQRCTKCDQYERTLAKLKKGNQKLQDKDLESKNQRCTKCDQYERTLAKLKKENQELQDRYNIVTTDLHNAEKKILDLKEENKDQKRQNGDISEIVKKLVQAKVELENQLRSQETSAATKDSGEVITLQRRINILQSDNADLIQKCKHKDGLQEKSDKDLRQLKTVISNLQSDIVEHKQTNDTMSNRLEILREEKLELEEKMRRRSPQVVSDARNCQNCWKHRNEISDLKRDINHLRDRLSEAAGNKLRENNPNIADLSDMNRPTSLADKFNSLYTDEYTDAMEVIEESMDEAGAVQVMLEWLKCCYTWCERLAREQRDLLTTESIGFMNKYQGQKIDYVVSGNCLIHVKEFQKKIAVDTLTAVRKICHVKSVTQENLIQNNYIVKYIQRCSDICWMMQITDPPLSLKFDVKNNEDLDKTLYNAFTKNGSKIEYLVWPILFLHKSGPMLAKGVAQGT